MGGLAKIARERGHEVTGCDAQVYPPMSEQLRALGIELHEGYDAEQLDALHGRPLRGRQRDDARQAGDRGDPRPRAALRLGPAVALRARAAGQVGAARSRARTARPPRRRCSRGSSSTRGSNPGFLIGGIARNFDVSARATELALLRDRGRRVRHRVLRQALEVRLVPAAHRDPQQPRVRPRRHLSRPRGDRDAVPPPGAHRARRRACWWSTATQAALERVLAARLLDAGRALRRRRSAWSVGAVHADDSFEVRAATASCRARCAGRSWASTTARTRSPRSPPRATPGVPVAARHRGAVALRGREAAHGGARHGRRHHRLRRLRPPSDGVSRPPSRGCASAWARRASSRCSSRARTR